MLTQRFKMTGLEHKEKAIALHPKGSYIASVWHAQVLGILPAHAWSYPFLVLASRSKDGEFAAHVSKKLGLIPVRGSSRKGNVDKGGKEAMNLYIEKLKEGNRGGITVDGPKGPRHVSKPGIALIAQAAECTIVPIVATFSSYYEFGSWDRFMLPYPFAKILVRHGEPLAVPKNATTEDIEKICRELDKRMEATQILADQDLKNWKNLK